MIFLLILKKILIINAIIKWKLEIKKNTQNDKFLLFSAAVVVENDLLII